MLRSLSLKLLGLSDVAEWERSVKVAMPEIKRALAAIETFMRTQNEINKQMCEGINTNAILADQLVQDFLELKERIGDLESMRVMQ